jgi:antitoxin YefM
VKTVKVVKARAVGRGEGRPSVAAKRRERDMVMVSRQEYEGLKETIDLLSRPANASRLRSALAQAKAGKLKERDL